MNYKTFKRSDGVFCAVPGMHVSEVLLYIKAEFQDWLIMKARVKASLRGATPLETQRNVEKFNE